MELKLQSQYDKIYAYFKSTSEAFDDLNWDGIVLIVFYQNEVIEKYDYSNLLEMIPDFREV